MGGEGTTYTIQFSQRCAYMLLLSPKWTALPREHDTRAMIDGASSDIIQQTSPKIQSTIKSKNILTQFIRSTMHHYIHRMVCGAFCSAANVACPNTVEQS